jgi:hypothetical protein
VEARVLYDRPLRADGQGGPAPLPRHSARALASGEAPLASAALALLRGAHGDGLACAGVSERAGAAYVAAIRARYGHYNAFHNWRHVVFVAHATELLLGAPGVARALPAGAALALTAAALGHDAGHRGTTSAFEVRTRSAIAAAHGGSGPVLERYHTALTLAALGESGVLGELQWGGSGAGSGSGSGAGAGAAASAEAATGLVRAAIMATDMGVHGAVLASLEARAARVAGGGPLLLPASAPDLEAFAGEVLHCTDVGAAAYSATDMKAWAAALYTEFTELPERERAACVPVTPFFAELVGAPLAQARMQAGFVAGVVQPLWAALHVATGGALGAQVARIAAAHAFHCSEVARLEGGR